MKLSTKARYALRAMIIMALNTSQKPLHIKEIAKREKISPKYLEHIMVTLSRAGLVKGVRGKKGGFVLAKPISKISVGDIVRASGEKIDLLDCFKKPSVCDRYKGCISKNIWFEIQNVIEKILNSTSLKRLIKNKQNQAQDGAKN